MNEMTRPGGHLKVGLEWEVDIIDPPSSFGGWNTGRVAQQMFESLVEDDLEKEGVLYTDVVPALARRYDISPDGLEYTFFLRDDVRFHDGQPFDAAAVKFNLERLWKEDAPHYYPVAADYNRVALQTLKEIRILDEHTIKLVMFEPFADFLRYMTQEDGPGALVYLSPCAVERYGNEDVADRAAGTGPFRFKNRLDTDFGSAVIVDANVDYWGGRPYLDQISFTPLPDPMDRVKALRDGTVDLVYGPEPTRIEELREEGFIVGEGPIPYVWYFIFNTREKPFSDVRVRRAICHAFNRTRLSQELFAGNTVAPAGLVPPACPSYEPDFHDYYPYDPRRAANLLAEAGYPDGFPFKVMSVTGGSAQLAPVAICEWLKRDLAEVGISAELMLRDDWVPYCNEWRLGVPNGVGASQNSWGMSCDIWLEHVVHSKNISPRAFNVGYYGKPEIDRLLDLARTEMRDSRRTELYRVIHRLVMEDAPLLPVANIRAGAVVHSPRVRSFKYPAQNWHDFKRVWVERD